MYFFYYIPVGLDIKVTKRVFVTKFIAVTAVIVFILSKYVPYNSGWNAGNLLFFPSSPSIASALTYSFVHLSWLHLTGNILYLVIFGRPLEDRLGPGLFFTVFALTSVAGAYAHLALARHFMPSLLNIAVGGASGAVSGLLGAFMVRFYYSRIRVAYWVFMPLQAVNKAGKTMIPVILAVIFWFLYQGVYAVMQFGTGSIAVAYGVHIGGFICGMVLALLFGWMKQARRESHLVKARRHFQNAEWFSSQGEYLNYLEYSYYDAEAQAEAARTFLCTNRNAAAADHFAAAVQLFNQKGEKEKAQEIFLQAVRNIPFFKLEQSEYLDMAFGVERSLKFYRASEVYENFLSVYPFSKDIPLILLRLAGIYKGRLEKPGKAIEYYNRIISEFPDTEWTGFAGLELEKLLRNSLAERFAAK